VCFAISHRDCPKVLDLQQKAEESKKTLTDMKNKLQEHEDSLATAISDLEKHVQNLEKRLPDSVVQIDKMCDQLKQAVENRRSQLKEELFSAHQNAKKKAADSKSMLSLRQRSASAHLQVINCALESKSPDVLLGIESSMSSRFGELELCSSEANIPMLADVQFSVDDASVSRLRQDIEGFGDVDVSEVEFNFASNHTHTDARAHARTYCSVL
jgi:myosin heavy subunit